MRNHWIKLSDGSYLNLDNVVTIERRSSDANTLHCAQTTEGKVWLNEKDYKEVVEAIGEG